MERREELLKVIEGMDETAKVVNIKLIDDMVFLEKRLDHLRTLPLIEINPKNPVQQRATVASRQYKELLQQYLNTVKLLIVASKKGEVEEDSPLRAYYKNIGV